MSVSMHSKTDSRKSAIGLARTASLPGIQGSAAAILLAGVCFLMLLAKLLLIWRININWDEFFHLSHVYDAVRNEMTAVFQRVYVHAFQWLPGVGSDEIDQVRAGRVVAWVCFVATVLLVARLASRWASPTAAWVAPLAFLAASPVLRHGASFRADSWLAPLCLLGLVLITGRRDRLKQNAIAGLVFGVSFAISLKTILMAPLFLALLLCTQSTRSPRQSESRNEVLIGVLSFCGASAVTAGALFLMHWLTLPSIAPGAVQGFAANAASKTLLEVPFLPRWDYLGQTLSTDWVSWLLVLGGFAVAVARFRSAALCVLSLAPLLFYRNAFPYYYVIMLAPAAVLAAVAVDSLTKLSESRSPVSSANWIPIVASLPLILQAALNLGVLRTDSQEFQQLTLSAVHEIFAEPVPYIDHSGMVASFPKANFFMSSWGMENYRERGVGFMEQAIAEHRPPMVLANWPVLMPGSSAFDMLIEEDRRYIEHSYVPYWGAIRIAGAEGNVEPTAETRLDLPFPGRYRVETEQTVTIDGVRFADGEMFETSAKSVIQSVSVRSVTAEAGRVRLIWGEAGPPPDGWLPANAALYQGL
jgi:hypothetical protein